MIDLAVVDFGAGNVHSMAKALAHLGARPEVVTAPAGVARAARVVVPGVGHFGAAAAALRARGLEPALREVVAAGRPLLGVCVGLQLLFEASEEAPGASGLGLLAGACRRFDVAERATEGDRPRLKVPQVGWNPVTPRPGAWLFRDVAPGTPFYFVHSYYAVPGDPAVVSATASYGLEYCCAVERGALAAVQFHPEKSGRDGLAVLRNFLAFDRVPRA